MSRAPKPRPESTAPRPTGLVRSAGRPDDIVAFDDAVIGYFVEAADLLGIPKSVTAIYGICFASPEPLSFSDINERLDISSGSISQGLRVLREVGALKIAQPENALPSERDGQPTLKADPSHEPDGSATPKPRGARQSRDARDGDSISASQHLSVSAFQRAAARYEPDLELRKLILHWLDQRLQPQLNSGNSRLDVILKSVPPAHNGSSGLIQQRLESLQGWHDKARALLPIAKTFLKLT